MNKLEVLSFIAAAAVLAGCGGGGANNAAAPAGGSGSLAAAAFPQATGLAEAAGPPSSSVLKGVQDALTVGMQCAQMSGIFPVDYATARSLVPSEYEVVQLPNGKALMMMPIQDCNSLVLNGSAIAGAPIVHFWIQVAGPEDYVEVAPGAVAKRDYYYSAFEHTTSSNALRQPVKQLGFEGTPIDGMTLGEVVPTPYGYSVRQGGVLEKDAGQGISYGYRWQEQVFPQPASARPVAHTYYHTKNPGMKGEADVRCLVSLYGSGYAQLTVDPRSEVAVFGTTLMGQTLDLTMHCDATMWQAK